MTTTHDFFDGRGPVPAHIHVNTNGLPGGWVDDTATVDPRAVIREGAVIRKRAVIREGAVIRKRAVIRKGAVIGEGADKIDYAALARDYREYHPDIPVIENLDARILEFTDDGKRGFDMREWHGKNSCGTTHCRAGTAIHLAGKAGYALEKRVGPAVAGGMIYRASTGRWPDFYCDTEAALEDIRACAAMAKEGTP